MQRKFNIKEKLAVLDLEIYPNYVLFAFQNLASGNLLTFELTEPDAVLCDDDKRKMTALLKNFTTFGFNSLNFDMPIIMRALSGGNATDLFNLCNTIIENKLKAWIVYRDFNLNEPSRVGFDHFDLIEPAPDVAASLKMYMARMHSKTLQDLPYEAGTWLTSEQKAEVKKYCGNDLAGTIELYNEIKQQIELRVSMSNEYGVDLRSKSDAQIAEAVLKSEIEKITGNRLYKPSSKITSVKYKAPENIKFKTPLLQNLLKIIETHEFKIDGRGSIVLPKEISGYGIKIGKTEYQVGVGGLHSKDSQLVVTKKDGYILADRDVASYYPNIILALKLFPKHVGGVFLRVYNSLVERRLAAKAAGNKVVAESLKVVINGLFGKLGSIYSLFYSPDLMARVTISGQLYLLMLIEQLELNGISVVSANTDGFVSYLHESKFNLYDGLCMDWEFATNFTLEQTEYKGLYARDVNNYFAVTTGGKIKGKGVFAEPTLKKSPTARIVANAVVNYVVNGVPFIQTLKECEDIAQFITVRKAKGGAAWNGQYLGRVARWLYTTDGTVIRDAKSNDKVAKSEGAECFQVLPDALPKNIDYAKYRIECEELFESIFGGNPC